MVIDGKPVPEPDAATRAYTEGDASDSYGASSELYTRVDFGCVLYEVQDGAGH